MNQPRKPKGQPTGGQFAPKSNPEGDIELASPRASVRPLSEIETDMDRLRSEAQTAAVSEMSAVVLEQYPDATHVRLDTLYVDSNAYATAGAVQLADGTQIEIDDVATDTWDTIEAYAGTIWPDCEHDREESMLVPLAPPGSARTTQPARPEGTVEHEAHWVGGVRQRPAICMACGASVSQDDHGTWIDETGGDVCGVDGDNAPHMVEAAFGVGAGGPGVAAAIDPNQQLYGFLDDVRARFAAGERPVQVSGPFGTHGMGYGEEDGEAYAVVGFALPDGVYAETDGGTYGELQGFRIFIDAE